MKNIFLLVSLFCVFFSCKQSSDNVVDGVGQLVLISLENEFSSDEYDVELNFIPLDTKPDYLVGQIQCVLYKNDMFYIKNMLDDQILIFDKTGKCKDKLSCKGKGPGEYLQILDFFVSSNGDIYVLDDLDIKRYDANCEYVESFKRYMDDELYPIGFYITPSGCNYYWNLQSSDPKYNIGRNKLYVTKENKIIGRYFEVCYKDYFSKRFYDYGGRVLVVPPKLDYSIFAIDEGVVSEAYRMDFGALSLPQKYHTQTFNVENTSSISKEVAELSVFWDIDYPVETSRFLTFSATKGNNVFQFIHDKQRGKCFHVENKNDNPLLMRNIRGVIDDSIFFRTIEPTYLLSFIEKMDDEEKSKILSKFNGYDLNANNNPIIITWKIKYNAK